MISPNLADLEEPQPQETPPQGSTGASRIILWLIALSLGILFMPLYLLSTTIKENTGPLRDELATLEAQLTATPAPNATEEQLRSDLLSLSEQIRALGVVNTDLETNHINWPGVMADIAGYDSTIMQLTELTQSESANQVSISGTAQNESVVTAYADSLRGSKYFKDVSVQSLNLKILPTVTPVRGSDATPVPVDPSTTRVVEFVVVLTLRTGSNGESQ